jgi:hypothetical protein
MGIITISSSMPLVALDLPSLNVNDCSKAELQILVSMLLQATSTSPVIVKLYLLYPSTARLQDIFKLFAECASLGAGNIQPWFLKSPNQHMLDQGTMLRLHADDEESRSRPKPEPVNSRLLFANRVEYAQIISYGAMDENDVEVAAANSRELPSYQACISPFPSVVSTSRTPPHIMICIPGSNSALASLPAKGSQSQCVLNLTLSACPRNPTTFSAYNELPLDIVKLTFYLCATVNHVDFSAPLLEGLVKSILRDVPADAPKPNMGPIVANTENARSDLAPAYTKILACLQPLLYEPRLVVDDAAEHDESGPSQATTKSRLGDERCARVEACLFRHSEALQKPIDAYIDPIADRVWNKNGEETKVFGGEACLAELADSVLYSTAKDTSVARAALLDVLRAHQAKNCPDPRQSIKDCLSLYRDVIQVPPDDNFAQTHDNEETAASGEPSQTNSITMVAERLDTPPITMEAGVAVFIARVPKESRTDTLPLSPRRPVDLGLGAISDAMTWTQFNDMFMEDAPFVCQFKESPATKPSRLDIVAFSEAMHPPKAQDFPLSRWASQLRDFLPALDAAKLLPFRERSVHDGVPVLATSPETKESEDVAVAHPSRVLSHYGPVFSACVTGSASAAALKLYLSLDEDKQTAFRELASNTTGLFSVSGCFGSGKTHLAMAVTSIILESDPAAKDLYVTPANALADELPDLFNQFQANFGFPVQEDEPFAIRVYSMPVELDFGMKGSATYGRPSEPPEPGVTAIEQFLASHILQEAAENHRHRRHSRAKLETRALHTEVFACYAANPTKYPALGRVISAAKMKMFLTTEEQSVVGRELQGLYEEVLRKARVVVTTHHAARSAKFRRAFRPTLLVMDDTARTREITTVGTMVCFPDVVLMMLVGDPRQLRPFTLFEPQIQLPFHSQLQVSLLERIVDSGKVSVALHTCHRQFADLGIMMSRIIYHGRIRFAQDQWNTTAIAVNRLLHKYLGSRVKERQNRYLISVKDATSKQIASDSPEISESEAPGAVRGLPGR